MLYLIGGSLLVATQLRATSPRWVVGAAHALTAAALSWSALILIVLGAWSGAFLYGEMGLLLALLPLLSGRLARFDVSSLRARVAFVLAIAVAVPLIAVVSEQALRESTAEARKLALVASRTDNAVLIVDVLAPDKLRIAWVNESFTRRTGYTLEEARGRTRPAPTIT